MSSLGNSRSLKTGVNLSSIHAGNHLEGPTTLLLVDNASDSHSEAAKNDDLGNESGHDAQLDAGDETNSLGDLTEDEDIARIRAKALARHILPRVKPIARDDDDGSPPPPPIRYIPPPPPPQVSQAISLTPPTPIATRTTRMGSVEFKQRSTFSAIEVLLEEPRVTMRSWLKKGPSSNANSNDPSKDAVQPVLTQIPTKIRIRSPTLLMLLEDIVKMSGHAFTAKNTMHHQLQRSYIPCVSMHDNNSRNRISLLTATSRYFYTRSSCSLPLSRTSGRSLSCWRPRLTRKIEKHSRR